MEVHVEEHEGDSVALRVADAVRADLVVGVARASVGRRGQGAVVNSENGVAALKENEQSNSDSHPKFNHGDH